MTLRQLALCCLLALGAPGAWAAPLPTPVPLGITDLLADPACTVGYQRYGEPPHVLGWRWTGFDPESGVYFTPEGEGGRRQVFMHCAWTPSPGTAFADFSLRLPRTSRIRLEGRTALRSSAAGSDGVTYTALLGGKRIWEATGAWKEWRDFSVDLSPYAGQVVTLRLQVGPGPQRSTTDDWSLWGKAEIIAGTEAEVSQARIRNARLQSEARTRDLRAGAALADADLTAFSSARATSSRPSTSGPVATSLTERGGRYAFVCRGRDETVEYRFQPRTGLVGGLEVWVAGRRLDPAPFAGGPSVLLGGKLYASGSRDLSCRLLSALREGNTLICRYEYRAPGGEGAARLTARLHAEGKSLLLALEGAPNAFTGFAVRSQGGQEVPAPFAIGRAPVRHPRGAYCSAFPDLWRSDASGLGPQGQQSAAAYSPLTDGTRRPLRETFILTASSRYEETLANPPHAPSPFLSDLAGRVVLDMWNGSFAEHAAWLRDLARYGVDRFLIINHVWQRDGYDHTYPNVFPANAAMGGDAGLRRLADTARALGHRFCVHENFYLSRDAAIAPIAHKG